LVKHSTASLLHGEGIDELPYGFGLERCNHPLFVVKQFVDGDVIVVAAFFALDPQLVPVELRELLLQS